MMIVIVVEKMKTEINMIIDLVCSVCQETVCKLMVKHDYDLLKILGSLCQSCEKQGKAMPEIYNDLK